MSVRRIVLATTHDGYTLSVTTVEALLGLGHSNPAALARDHPDLVQVVERLGDLAGGPVGSFGEGPPWGHARLRVASIPSEADWVIEDYDGVEWIVTAQRWTEQGPISRDEIQPWRRREER